MNANSPRIISFGNPTSPQHTAPVQERVLSGNPEQTIWNHYADASEQFFAGVWSSTRGKWRVQYTENEFCHLLAGAVVVTSDQGESWEFWAGDSFVVPAGFAGTWEVIEDCRKLYAIFEPR
jgi:uncharacterized cupin superfamily protein